METFSRNVLITLAVTDSLILVLLLVVIFALIFLLRRARRASQMQAKMNAELARKAPVYRNNGFIAPSVAFSPENNSLEEKNAEDEDGYMVPNVKADKDDEEHIYDEPAELLQGNDPKKDDEEYIYNDPSELLAKKKKDVNAV